MNGFFQDDFFNPAADAVHPADPFYLLCCLQPFRNAFLLGHLADQQLDAGLLFSP